MKIGILCYPTFGGSGVVATELGKSLSRKGNTVHFISYAQPARLNVFSDNLFYHEVSVKNYPLFDFPPYETSLTSKLVEIVMFEKLDLIHVHYAIPHASAAVLAKQILKTMGIDIPVITTLHGTDITLVGKDPSCKPVINHSINLSDAVSAVSKSLRDDTLKTFDIKKDIDVVPNFIDIKKKWPKSMPNGIIHSDLFIDNIFFYKKKYYGFIDFYFSANDFLAYELATCVNALCFKKRNKVFVLDKNKSAQLLRGYQSIRKLNSKEKSNFNTLCRGSALRYLLTCLLYTSPSPRDVEESRIPSSG